MSFANVEMLNAAASWGQRLFFNACSCNLVKLSHRTLKIFTGRNARNFKAFVHVQPIGNTGVFLACSQQQAFR
jgi:hypothetical protein